jgi:hypothetical protein
VSEQDDSQDVGVPIGPVADQLGVRLHIHPGEQVTEMMVIMKRANFETGTTSVAFSFAEGMDWVQRRALIYVAEEIMRGQPLEDA